MSAATTSPDEMELPVENGAMEQTAEQRAAEIANLVEVQERARIRWAAAVAAEALEEPAPDPFDDFADLKRRLGEQQRQAVEHSAVCTQAVCDRCERFGCRSCRTARVPEYSGTCGACRMRDALTAMKLPERYHDALEHVGARVRSAAARRLVAEALVRSYLATGPAGVGKSTWAAAMAQAVAKKAIEAGRRLPTMLFASAIDLGLARSQHRLGVGEAELVAAAMHADVLILDDLGAEAVRDVDAITAVIHSRHDHNRPMWITTGLSDANISARYGGGIERRIYENTIIVDCAGGSAACGAR